MFGGKQYHKEYYEVKKEVWKDYYETRIAKQNDIYNKYTKFIIDQLTPKEVMLLKENKGVIKKCANEDCHRFYVIENDNIKQLGKKLENNTCPFCFTQQLTNIELIYLSLINE